MAVDLARHPRPGTLAACVMSILMLSITLTPSPALARHRGTFVTYDCLHVKMQPGRIMFACADGNYYARRLHWSMWHVRRAAGSGVFHFNDCKPDCANGTFHTRTGNIRLRNRIWCKRERRYVFNVAHIRYDKPWHHSRRTTVRGIGCPLHF
jgi:hypothetical protein